MTNLAVQQNQETHERPVPRLVWRIAAFVAAAAFALVAFIVYLVQTDSFEIFACVDFVTDSPPSTRQGGQQASVPFAAVMSVGLWLGYVTIASTTRLRRSLLLALLAFALVDVAALGALWYLSPAIWGPDRCVLT